VINIELKRFQTPDEVRTFEKGRFEIVRIGEMILGRATYEPGWRWSTHVAGIVGKPRCDVEHIGMVLSGRAAVEMDDGMVRELSPGDIFHISPSHDSWVLGEAPYVSLHFMGAADYAKHAPVANLL
jgi:hypothetical protein